MKTKINIGCGSLLLDGYINLDKNDYGQDVIRDVLKGLPFENDKFEEIYTSHFMEHIRTGEDLYFVLSEIWRVGKNSARFIIRVPHSDTQEAFYPDHLSYWNEKMVMAIVNDPYQKSKEYCYHFEIIGIQREGIELQVILKIIKNNE